MYRAIGIFSDDAQSILHGNFDDMYSYRKRAGFFQEIKPNEIC